MGLYFTYQQRRFFCSPWWCAVQLVLNTCSLLGWTEELPTRCGSLDWVV